MPLSPDDVCSASRRAQKPARRATSAIALLTANGMRQRQDVLASGVIYLRTTAVCISAWGMRRMREALAADLVRFIIHADLGNVRHLIAAFQQQSHPLR